MLLLSAAVLLVLLVVVGWRLSGVRRARRGRVWPRTPPVDRSPSVPPAPLVALGLPVPAQDAETSARAFPVDGLPASPERLRALQAILRRLAGVTQAYVSPVTALVYVQYTPTAITPTDVADAIRRAGYRVADETRWFDWQHRSESHA
jgi:copper chaperone CopZ